MKKIKKQGYEVVGLELNKYAVEVASQKGLTVYNDLIEDFASKNKVAFDVVCFFQVLEYITNVKSFLESAVTCLKKDGILIIGVPNNNPYLYRFDKFHTLNLPPHHAGLWDVSTFEKLDSFFDFKKKKILVEPLFDIRNQLIVYFDYKKLNLLAKLVKKIPSFVFGILKPILANHFDGRNIVAVFSKTNA